VTGAELTLRFGTTRVRASVHWPPAGAGSLTLLLAEEAERAEMISAAAATVVVALRASYPEAVELAALGWLAEHASELGPDSGKLLLAGGPRASQLAARARAAGIVVQELPR
jgi:hypothetical protein